MDRRGRERKGEHAQGERIDRRGREKGRERKGRRNGLKREK